MGKFSHTFLKFPFLLIVFVLCNHFAFAQTPRIDSLLRVLKTMKEDTSRANTLYELTRAYLFELNDNQKVGEYGTQELNLSLKLNFKKGIAYGYLNRAIYFRATGSLDSALVYDKKCLPIMQEIGNKKGESSCLQNIGLTYSHKGEFNEALRYLFQGTKIKDEIGDKKGLSSGYNNIGNIYSSLGNHVEALNYHLKSLKIKEELKDKLGISMSYNNIGNVFVAQNKIEKALEYYQKSLTINEELNDQVGIGSSSTNIGDVYLKMKRYGEAQKYFLKSLAACEKADDKRGMAEVYNTIGSAYCEEGKAAQGLSYAMKSYELYKKIDDKTGIVESSGCIGKLYALKNDERNAFYFDSLSLHLATAIDLKEGMRDAYINLAKLYKKQKQFEKALLYTNLYNNMKDSILNKDNFKQISELNTRYETDKKEKEILLLTKDQELKTKIIKQQQLVRWGLIGGLLLLFVAIYSIYRRYRFKQNANLLLNKQKEEIQQKNILITDSIEYAKTIQEAVFPPLTKIKELFPSSFLFYKPKDVVSGDFYWVGTHQDELICAVADCTGHGVPGAFMSLLGYNMLENAIKKQQQVDPAAILKDLNRELVNSLSKEIEGDYLKHGLDISLLSINTRTNKLKFAGAHNSLYIVRNNQLIEFKADKKGIGFVDKEQPCEFTNYTCWLNENDMLFLFTDGYPDQIGGPARKKFYYGPFKELLTSISPLSPEDQLTKLKDVHENWLGERKDQTDDILVMGIKY